MLCAREIQKLNCETCACPAANWKWTLVMEFVGIVWQIPCLDRLTAEALSWLLIFSSPSTQLRFFPLPTTRFPPTNCGCILPQFLDYRNLPLTSFSCEGKVIGGYYADVETGCQMFHVCTLGEQGKNGKIIPSALYLLTNKDGNFCDLKRRHNNYSVAG